MPIKIPSQIGEKRLFRTANFTGPGRGCRARRVGSTGGRDAGAETAADMIHGGSEGAAQPSCYRQDGIRDILAAIIPSVLIALLSGIHLMKIRPVRVGGLAACLLLCALPAARAVEVSPHRALYTLTLDTARQSSGVVGATGAMFYEWGETCDGWTIEQRFRLRLQFAESGGDDVSSTLVTWESKDGLRYRFNERRLRNGQPDEEIHGDAHLDGPGKGGVAEFVKPEATNVKLAPGVLFPTAHTLLLIERAQAGDQFISRAIFDGAVVGNAGQITAVIGPELKPNTDTKNPLLSNPLLQRPSWKMRLAFFPAGSKSEEPDYELGMRLLDNGVSQDMTLDYSDYIIKATLDHIEALPKPSC